MTYELALMKNNLSKLLQAVSFPKKSAVSTLDISLYRISWILAVLFYFRETSGANAHRKPVAL